jgi:hypothetical protein
MVVILAASICAPSPKPSNNRESLVTKELHCSGQVMR